MLRFSAAPLLPRRCGTSPGGYCGANSLGVASCVSDAPLSYLLVPTVVESLVVNSFKCICSCAAYSLACALGRAPGGLELEGA